MYVVVQYVLPRRAATIDVHYFDACIRGVAVQIDACSGSAAYQKLYLLRIVV